MGVAAVDNAAAHLLLVYSDKPGCGNGYPPAPDAIILTTVVIGVKVITEKL